MYDFEVHKGSSIDLYHVVSSLWLRKELIMDSLNSWVIGGDLLNLLRELLADYFVFWVHLLVFGVERLLHPVLPCPGLRHGIDRIFVWRELIKLKRTSRNAAQHCMVTWCDEKQVGQKSAMLFYIKEDVVDDNWDLQFYCMCSKLTTLWSFGEHKVLKRKWWRQRWPFSWEKAEASTFISVNAESTAWHPAGWFCQSQWTLLNIICVKDSGSIIYTLVFRLLIMLGHIGISWTNLYTVAEGFW